MATYDDSALRAELQAALDAIDPEVSGLQKLLTISESSSTKMAVNTQIEMRTRRRDLIRAEIAALNARASANAGLLADGYPGFTQPDVSDAVRDEIQGTENDVISAASLFGATTAAPQDQAKIAQIDSGMKSNIAAIGKAMQP